MSAELQRTFGLVTMVPAGMIVRLCGGCAALVCSCARVHGCAWVRRWHTDCACVWTSAQTLAWTYAWISPDLGGRADVRRAILAERPLGTSLHTCLDTTHACKHTISYVCADLNAHIYAHGFTALHVPARIYTRRATGTRSMPCRSIHRPSPLRAARRAHLYTHVIVHVLAHVYAHAHTTPMTPSAALVHARTQAHTAGWRCELEPPISTHVYTHVYTCGHTCLYTRA